MTQPQDGIDWSKFEGGSTGDKPEGDITSIVGQMIVAPDGRFLQAAYDQSPTGVKTLVLIDPNNPGGSAIPFPGAGEYWTADHKRFVVDGRGGLLSPPDTISESEWQGAFGKYGAEGGAGSDHYATDVAALLQKMQGLQDHWEQQIANVNSGVTYEAGRAGFEADWQKLVNDFNTTQATLQQNADDLRARLEDAAKEREISDVSIREREEANRRVSVAQEAGRRASTITGDVLPRFVSGNAPINVPFLGPARGAQVNFAELFNQGGPGNLAALPSIAPQFAGGYAPTPVSAPPQLPPLGPRPAYPGAPVYPGAPSALLSWLGMS